MFLDIIFKQKLGQSRSHSDHSFSLMVQPIPNSFEKARYCTSNIRTNIFCPFKSSCGSIRDSCTHCLSPISNSISCFLHSSSNRWTGILSFFFHIISKRRCFAANVFPSFIRINISITLMILVFLSVVVEYWDKLLCRIAKILMPVTVSYGKTRNKNNAFSGWSNCWNTPCWKEYPSDYQQ